MKRFWDWLLRRQQLPVPDTSRVGDPYRTIAERPDYKSVSPYEGDPHAELWMTVERARAARRYKMTEEEYEREFRMDDPPPAKIWWW